MTVQKLKVAFLDRDGTINVDRGYVHQVDDWEFTPLAASALRLLGNSGFRLAVVTNQSGIAAGRYTSLETERLNAFMRERLAQDGVRIDAIAYCPHSPADNCDCRKPKIGMARSIETELCTPIDFAASWTIGDKLSDIEFGKTLGTKTALIRSPYWTDSEPPRVDMIVDSLFEAARRICAIREA